MNRLSPDRGNGVVIGRYGQALDADVVGDVAPILAQYFADVDHHIELGRAVLHRLQGEARIHSSSLRDHRDSTDVYGAADDLRVPLV